METPTVPSRHFEIAPEPGGAQIVDRQSTNGTAAIGAYLAMRRVLMGSKAAKLGEPDAMFNLGLLAFEAGDLDAARAWYQQAAKLENENPSSN